MMLAGQQIRKAFGKTEVLHGVDLSVTPGRITVLMGPSGSGKTTLVRALSLLDWPTAGVVAIDDDTYSFPWRNHRAFRKPWPKVTVVFQQHFLWPHLTLKQNILLPVADALNDHPSLDELVGIFGMGDFIDRYPNQVSLGQRQRAALARAFVLNPKYILLDEITSALDVEQTGVVVRHLLSLRAKGIGMLVVTHLLDFAQQLVGRDEGDQVYFLEEGQILGAGGVEFFEKPGNERIRQFLTATEYWRQNEKN